MLTTNLKLAEKYNYLDPKFKKAFEFLRTADLDALPLGNTPIDGDEVFANVQAYTTLPDARATKNILTCSSSSPARNASATRRAISASPQWLTMLTATLCSMRNPPRAAASS